MSNSSEIAIKELAFMIKNIVGYKGEFYFNTSNHDGTMVKLTDPSNLHAFGWEYTTELEGGIRKMSEWYLTKYKEENV